MVDKSIEGFSVPNLDPNSLRILLYQGKKQIPLDFHISYIRLEKLQDALVIFSPRVRAAKPPEDSTQAQVKLRPRKRHPQTIPRTL